MAEYEWTCEELDEHGEIVDSSFADTLAEVAGYAPDDKPFSIGLVRDTYFHGMTIRSWAYIKDGRMPTEFLDANGRHEAKVPKRFLAEFTRAMSDGILPVGVVHVA